ncbi:MAG: hypothetical protein Q4A69_09105 [Moraxella sp.]|nr:hypothetical protein [Moraxella sp.]
MEAFSLHSLLMTSLLALNPTAQPAQEAKIEVYEIPAMAGLWQVAEETTSADETVCVERYNFGLKGHVQTTSGGEITYGQYRYAHQEEGLPILAVKTIYDNNAPDCMGSQIDQSGHTFATFVALNNRHDPSLMRWCNDKEGQTCPITLQRVLP